MGHCIYNTSTSLLNSNQSISGKILVKKVILGLQTAVLGPKDASQIGMTVYLRPFKSNNLDIISHVAFFFNASFASQAVKVATCQPFFVERSYFQASFLGIRIFLKGKHGATPIDLALKLGTEKFHGDRNTVSVREYLVDLIVAHPSEDLIDLARCKEEVSFNSNHLEAALVHPVYHYWAGAYLLDDDNARKAEILELEKKRKFKAERRAVN